MAAASTSTTAEPGTKSHVADRRSAGRALVAKAHMNSAEGEDTDTESAKDAVASQRYTTRRLSAAIINSTTASAATKSPLPASAPSKPPTPTTPSKKSSTTPSAPVTVHPATTTIPTSPPRKPKMRQRPLSASTPHTSPPSTEPPPPDPALFTFPSLLTTLGPEASTPLHAIAEICGRSKMSLADEHGSHMPVVGNMLADGPVGGQKKKGKEGEGEATQRLDGRGRGAISGGISMGGGALDGEERGNGASGKGWMEGVMAWLWGDKGRERRKGVRELRRGLEEEGREGEAGQG